MAALLAPAVGCSSGDGDGPETSIRADAIDLVSDGADTAAAETDAQLVTSSLVASSAPEALGLASRPGDLDTRAIGDGARALYFPIGCLDVSNDTSTNTATYTFDECIGPNGLRGVTGQVKASYAVETTASRLRLDLHATSLSVNKAKVDFQATADVTATSGGGRQMTWRATVTGVSGRGRTLERTTTHTLSWQLGEACFNLEGSSEGRVNGRAIRTVIEDFRRCRRGCPDAGGKVVVTDVERDLSIELAYDGTNRATFVGADGKTTAVTLACVP